MKIFRKLFFIIFFPLLTSSNLYSVLTAKDAFEKAKNFVLSFIEEVKKKPKTNLSELFSRLPGIQNVPLLPSFNSFLKSIQLEAPDIKIGKNTYDIKWKDPLVLGTKKEGMIVRLFIGPGEDKNFGISLGAGVPGEFTLNDIFPDIKEKLQQAEEKLLPQKMLEIMKKLKLTVDDIARTVDMFKFTNCYVLASANEYEDPVWGKLEFGVNVHCAMRFVGPFAEFEEKIFGKNLIDSEFRGRITLPPQFIGTEIRSKVPGGIRLVKIGDFEIQTADLEAILGIKGLGLTSGLTAGKLSGGVSPLVPFPHFKIIGGLKVKFPFQENFVDFKIFGDFVASLPPNLTIGGQMDGMIEDIFGIPGADIGNLGISATFDPAPPYIRGGAFQGEIAFGKSRLKTVIGGQFLSAGGANDIIVLANGTGITKDDLIEHSIHVLKRIGEKFKINVDLQGLEKSIKAVFPPFKIGPLDLAFVPKNETEVFGKKYAQGMHLKTSGSLFGIGGGIEMNVVLLGGIVPTVEYTMWMDEIKVPDKAPLLIITGGGPDGVRGKGIDGPVLTANLSLNSQKVFIDGLIRIPGLGISSETRMLISPIAGIEFKMAHKLGGIFDTELEFQGKRSLNSWWIKGYMKQNAIDEIIKLLTVTSDKVYKQAIKDIEKAKSNLDKAKANLDKEKQKLVDWEKKAKEDIDKWVKTKIAQTQWHIDNLKKKIKSAQDKCKQAPPNKKLVKCAETLAIPAWGTALGALEIHKRVTLPKLINQAAKGGVKFASDMAKAGIKTAKSAINVAKGSVKGAVLAIGVANKVGKVAAKALEVLSKGVVQIKEVSVEGSLEELVKKARMAKVKVKASVFGKPFDQEYQIDFKNPDQFPKQIFSGLKQIFS